MRKELKVWIKALAIAIVGIPILSLASNLAIPNSFTPDTLIDANAVNANFTAVQAAVNSKQDAIVGSCPAGQAVSAIAADGGALTCAPSGLAYGTSISGSSTTAGLWVIDSAVNGTAIEGQNTSTGVGGTGVFGGSTAVNGIGVTGSATNGIGLFGLSGDASHPGVSADNATGPTGIALSINQGYFQVTGAGQANGGNTSTTAFVWKATAASISGSATVINNPMTNGNPNLILIVTQNLVATAATNGHSVGVEYSPLELGLDALQRRRHGDDDERVLQRVRHLAVSRLTARTSPRRGRGSSSSWDRAPRRRRWRSPPRRCSRGCRRSRETPQ